ncbi:MAG: OmpA family protein [Clostridia bacterium]
MKDRRRNFTKTAHEESYWPSFADVMSTFSLVMLFLVVMVFLKNISISINLKGEQQKLIDTRHALQEREAELTEKQNLLIQLESLLNAKEEALIILGQELNALEQELETSKEELKSINEEKKNAEELLVILIQSLEEKQRIIAVNDEELKLLRGKLEEISVMRAELFASVKETVEAQLGTTNEQGLPLVEIGDNANIIINEAVLFDTAQWTIKPEGKKLLDEFAIAFENILKNPGMRDIIDSITVEGHADKTGDEFSNMTLSLNRANAVIRYMFESNPNLLLNYNNYFAAAGYSEFRPIDPGDSAQALAKNRRIEFAIKIKDSTIQKVINDYLEETEGITDTD